MKPAALYTVLPIHYIRISGLQFTQRAEDKCISQIPCLALKLTSEIKQHLKKNVIKRGGCHLGIRKPVSALVHVSVLDSTYRISRYNV